MKCSACGRDGLRSTTLAWVPSPNGGDIERRRVCGDCAGGALAIVLRKAHPECLNCSEPARFCADHAASREDVRVFLKRAAKKLRGLANGYRGVAGNHATHISDSDRVHAAGRVCGLEQAADILDAGDFS